MKENTDGWITHNGGECPIPDAKAGEYEVKFMIGTTQIFKLYNAYELEWSNANRSFDIIAYRLIEVQK